MLLPFQGEYMQLNMNPGVPLRSAPGYVLVALRGAFFQGTFIQSKFFQCSDDYVV